MNYRGKHVLIIGCSRSGTAAAHLLTRLRACVRISDTKSPDALADHIAALPEGVDVRCGPQEHSLLNDIERVVISPGVPLTIPLVKEALRRRIPVIGEVELAWEVSSHQWVGITGTDGKSTTTALVGHCIKGAGRQAFVAGNIGVAVSTKMLLLPEDTIIVAELSSFQLETIHTFTPAVGALLNINEDHLDRYPSMDEYAAAKMRLFMNQTENDTAVINGADKRIETLIQQNPLAAQALKFQRSELTTDGATIEKGMFVLKNGSKTTPIAPVAEIPLTGIHNQENVCAALCIIQALGIPPESLAHSLKTFHGLPHRMEVLPSRAGRRFINDSKATTVNSVLKALDSLDDRVILIAGGRSKGLPYEKLRSAVDAHCRRLILVGEARFEIHDALPFEPTDLCEGLDEAVACAYTNSESGDTILLSPACTSYDQYASFEERGNAFKTLVEELS